MEYNITLPNGDYVELPKYSLKIADTLESADKVLSGIETFKAKTKKAYDCLVSILGKEKVKEVFGDFANIDPNEVHVTYMMIVDCYNEPVMRQQSEQINRQLEDSGIDKFKELIDSAEKAKNLK